MIDKDRKRHAGAFEICTKFRELRSSVFDIGILEEHMEAYMRTIHLQFAYKL